MSNDQILSCFPPRLRQNIQELWRGGKIGISSMKMKLTAHDSRASQQEFGVTYKDHFTLEIPYAGKQICCEVFFDREDYDFAPDFDFPDEAFLADPDVDVINDHIPNLANWDVNNPKALKSVIRDFMILYKKFQLERLQSESKYARFLNDYMQLSSEQEVEVYIDNNGGIHFLISIPVDLSDLPEYIQPILLGQSNQILNPNEDTACLRVVFQKPDGGRIVSDLQPSPRLEQVIGASNTLHIPNYKKENGLVGYVSTVTKLLRDKVEQICDHFKKRNEYISELLSLHGQSIVEYDKTLYSKAVLLFGVEHFHALVHIAIGNRFPQEKPLVMLRSIYTLQHGKPLESNLDNYPYSPRWETGEMVQRLTRYLREEIPTFHQKSHS